MLRYCVFSWTSTPAARYVSVPFFHAFPHIRHGVVWGRVITSLHLRFHALPHLRLARLVETSDGVMDAGQGIDVKHGGFRVLTLDL